MASKDLVLPLSSVVDSVDPPSCPTHTLKEIASLVETFKDDSLFGGDIQI